MTKQFTYKQLQALATAEGIKANQSMEKLYDMLTKLGVIEENGFIADSAVIEDKPNPFAGFFADNRSQKQQAEADIAGQSGGFVSPNLMKFAKDLYRLHKLEDAILDTMSWQQVKAEIDRLQALPQPMSQAQEDALNKVLEELAELGQPVNVPKEVYAQLTGGRDGSASQLIDKLFNMRYQLQQNSPLTDKQAEVIIGWFLCPDIPFEDFDISKKIAMPNVSDVAWRFMTCDEFHEELKEKLTRQQASKFIDDYRASYFEWKKTRCSTSQKTYIRQLEERMANLSSPRQVEYAVIDGVVTQVVTSKPREYNPTAYAPMSDFDLEQMSYDDASRFITQLKSELEKPKRSSISNDTSQQRLQEKFQTFAEHTGAGRAKDEMSYKVKEHRKLSDFLFKLEAVVGWNNEDLHESCHKLMMLGEGNVADVSDELLAFITEALNKKAISFNKLVELADESIVVTQLIEMAFPVEYNQAIGGRKKEFTPQTRPMNEDKNVTDFIKNL